MGFIYKNITDQHQLIAVVNDAGTDVSHIPVGPGAKIEVTRPTLDVYLPHVLARLNEAGNDITHIILRQNEDRKTIQAADAKKLEAVSVPAVPAPAPVTPVVDVPAPVVEAAPAVVAPVAEVVPPAPKAAKKSKA